MSARKQVVLMTLEKSRPAAARRAPQLEEAVGADGLAVGADGGGSVVGGDDVHLWNILSIIGERKTENGGRLCRQRTVNSEQRTVNREQ